jgi:tRNA threonylcarbamoyl adenosine modification protein YeaZ
MSGSSAVSEERILALHSCTETFAVGVQSLAHPAGREEPPRIGLFPLGRALANDLFACLESVLPAPSWSALTRLAVATGPGGFTATRVTVVLARTLAQQLALPLDGLSSFQLMARRLWRGLEGPQDGPFWLVQDLPRHGVVAGLYEADPTAPGGVAERRPPVLCRQPEHLIAMAPVPVFQARHQLPDDLEQLLAFSGAAARAGLPSPWERVLPIYPTSPVGPT